MRKHRLWIPGLILLGAGISLVVSAMRSREDLTEGALQQLVTFVVAVLLLALWWLFLSGYRAAVRLGGLVLFTVVLAALRPFVHTDGTSGSSMPTLRFGLDDQTVLPITLVEPEGDPLEARALQLSAGDWPAFRGAQRDSVARGETLGAPAEAELLWKRPVGEGWSSLVLVGDWLFTQEQRGEYECTVAYDAGSGEERWVHADEDRYDTYLGGVGPRATPTFSLGVLYTVGSNGRLNALEAHTGRVLWTREMLEDGGGGLIEFGIACSPLVLEDTVYVVPGVNPGGSTGSAAAGVLAYDRADGTVRWRGGTRPAGYTAPWVGTFDGEEHLLVFGLEGLSGHDLGTGAELWFTPWGNTFKNGSVMPLVVDGEVLLSVFSNGAKRVAPRRAAGGGDDGDSTGWEVEERWRQRRFQLKFNGGVKRGDLLVGLDGGLLACIDWKTGERHWKEGRHGFGQILLADDGLLILSEYGEVIVADFDREGVTERLRFEALEGKCWNHPTLRDRRVYVRSDVEMACYELR
ncbi:MAG: PQQ-binding-like beta-propeller repeat protein [Planctomycetota bacterium]|nr:PQQ-binding-like beta-propeller repeat protein [Planctomycetota bacterium]